MREQFFIRLDAGEAAAWFPVGELGEAREGTLAEAATAAAGRQVTVLVPGTDVTLSKVAVPTRNRSRMAAAVPYLLEEQLAGDVEQVHFALGERDADGRVTVAAVSQARMDAWLARLAKAGIHADRLIPETLLLPYQPDTWSLLIERDRINLRSAPQAGMSVDGCNAAFVLRRAWAEAEPKPALLRTWVAGGVSTDALSAAELDVNPQVEPLAIPPLVFLARQAHEAGAVDLLQGAYSRRERLGKLWRPWRPAAALLAVWLVLQFGIKSFEYRQLRAEEAGLREEISRIYLQTFPEAKRVVDARLQMEQHLAALRGGSGGAGGFMKLLAAVSGTAAGFGGTQIEHLGYKDGELDIALTIADLQRLEQLKDSLGSATQLPVEIQSATARNDKVEARLQIKGGRS